jgi:hypothetical protein
MLIFLLFVCLLVFLLVYFICLLYLLTSLLVHSFKYVFCHISVFYCGFIVFQELLKERGLFDEVVQFFR